MWIINLELTQLLFLISFPKSLCLWFKSNSNFIVALAIGKYCVLYSRISIRRSVKVFRWYVWFDLVLNDNNTLTWMHYTRVFNYSCIVVWVFSINQALFFLRMHLADRLDYQWAYVREWNMLNGRIGEKKTRTFEHG